MPVAVSLPMEPSCDQVDCIEFDGTKYTAIYAGISSGCRRSLSDDIGAVIYEKALIYRAWWMLLDGMGCKIGGGGGS
jgi:hypothetical protein